jgi:hypothetical protein
MAKNNMSRNSRNDGLKIKILDILERVEKTRNDDIELMLHIWNVYHKDFLHYHDAKIGVTFESIRILPRNDDIKRIRAVIQNEEGKFLPTDPKVRRKRRLSEDDWRAWLEKEKINNQNQYGKSNN